MSPDGTTQPAPDLLNQIWSISTTLSDEAMNAARRKALEMNFDVNRGTISLQETFINLSSARSVLEDAIEQEKLIQLPITLQREILGNLTEIAKSIQGLTAGTDEVVNLVNSVEVLNTSIWKYGLHNLSDQVLGYQKKLNQLKNLEVQLNKGIEELKAAREAAERAIAAASEVDQKQAEATKVLDQLNQLSATSVELLKQIKDAGTESATLHSTIQQQEKQAGELTANIKTANNELSSIDTSMRKFYSEVEQYRDKINKTSQDAAELIRTSSAAMEKLTVDTNAKVDSAVDLLKENETSLATDLRKRIEDHSYETNQKLSTLIETSNTALSTSQQATDAKLDAAIQSNSKLTATLISDTQQKTLDLEKNLNERSNQTIGTNNEKTVALTVELGKLEEQIREQIQQATGFRLFGAFQARQNEIVKARNTWFYAILVLAWIAAVVTIWIAHEAQSYKVTDVALWIKLSLTIPLAYLITFCTVQYSRERRLEEEYAFKSAISVSLNPYRDLIRSMLEKDGTLEQTKYTQFVIDSVTNVFTPPTDKVFEGEKHQGFPKKALKEVAEVVGTIAKAAKP